MEIAVSRLRNVSRSFPEDYVWDTFVSNDPSPSSPSDPSDLEFVFPLKKFIFETIPLISTKFYSISLTSLGNKESGQKVLNTIPHFISEQNLIKKAFTDAAISI